MIDHVVHGHRQGAFLALQHIAQRIADQDLILPFAKKPISLSKVRTFVVKSVITSYSIHYTKLYEAAGLSPEAIVVAEGERLFRSGGSGDKQCASCHTDDPKQVGKTKVGKRIEPMAPIANRNNFV